MTQFNGKVALVTGGSRGIGKAIVQKLAQEGATVIFTYKSSRQQAEELTSSLSNNQYKVTCIQNDATDTESASKVVEQVTTRFGQLDILVNNAGITRDQLLMRMNEADWDEVIANNLKSVYNFSKAAIRPMISKRYGRIINITSVAGIVGNAGQTNYAASKAGIIGFTKSLAKEVASRYITVNAVAPGYIETDLTEQLTDEQKKVLNSLIPLKRLGNPDDVAKVVFFLCSPDADYITGQVINVDGGMVM